MNPYGEINSWKQNRHGLALRDATKCPSVRKTRPGADMMTPSALKALAARFVIGHGHVLFPMPPVRRPPSGRQHGTQDLILFAATWQRFWLRCCSYGVSAKKIRSPWRQSDLAQCWPIESSQPFLTYPTCLPCVDSSRQDGNGNRDQNEMVANPIHNHPIGKSPAKEKSPKSTLPTVRLTSHSYAIEGVYDLLDLRDPLKPIYSLLIQILYLLQPI